MLQGFAPREGPFRSGLSRRPLSIASLVLFCASSIGLKAQSRQAEPEVANGIWETGVAEGFRHGTQEVGLTLGPAIGLKLFGSTQAHNMMIASGQYGIFFSEVLGKGHWYRGNFEVLAHVFGSYQFDPDDAYAVGFAPLLRYDFSAGKRLVPFVDLGGGPALTNIRDGDLSTNFEFNLQCGTGLHYFLRDNFALTGQVRFLHLSNAGMGHPNAGVNTLNLTLGATWFF
jgi:hypothetical protein